MFPEPTELLLIGYSIDSIWTPRFKSKTLTPRTNSQKHWPREIFTRDEWNHFLCWSNISHFSSTNWSEVMSRRTHKDSGEERVTAESKPMVVLVSRCSERTPDVLASTASESPGKTRHESQFSSELANGAASQKQGDLLKTLAHQATQNGMLTRIGLLKSGNLMKCWKQERWDLFMNNHQVCSHSTRTSLLLMTMIWTLTPSLKTIRWILTPKQNPKCRLNHVDSCTWCMIECERGRTNPQQIQHNTVTNIL